MLWWRWRWWFAHHPRHCLPVQRITWYVFASSLAGCQKGCSLTSDIQPSAFFFVWFLPNFKTYWKRCWWGPIHIPDQWSLHWEAVRLEEREVSLLLVFFYLLCILTANWWPCNRSFVPGDFEWWELSRQRTGPEPFDHDEILLGQLFYTVWYLIWCHQCK